MRKPLARWTSRPRASLSASRGSFVVSNKLTAVSGGDAACVSAVESGCPRCGSKTSSRQAAAGGSSHQIHGRETCGFGGGSTRMARRIRVSKSAGAAISGLWERSRSPISWKSSEGFMESGIRVGAGDRAWLPERVRIPIASCARGGGSLSPRPRACRGLRPLV